MGQPASAPGVHPPEISGVGALPGSQVGRPAGVSAVGPQSANLGACNRDSGERWGCLSCVHSPGAEGGRGARGLRCCEEFSKQLLSASIFSFSFREIPPIQAPLVQTSTWLLTQPSLALSQESCSRPCTPAVGFSCPGPRTGPRDLIVLKHSFYRLIFQCPLSLVSDLHICWNTVGCSLCSSDQLAVSLVLRGSGLCSHLSRHHLPPAP